MSDSNAQRSRFVHRLFDAISGRYDLFNRISSLGLDQGWRRRTIASLRLTPGMRVLDLASGTGDLSRWAAMDLVPLGGVVACDFSFPMLRFSRRKFERVPAAHWHVQLTQAKAEALPFAEQVFDAATIGFALRNVSDLDTVFRELFRVMKPGGRLGLLEFGRASNPLLRAGQKLWLSTGVPLIGALTTGKLWPFTYLRRSILRFMVPEEVVRRLKEVGFTQVKVEPIQGGIVLVYQALRS